MPLRGKTPEVSTKRLKLMMFGPAGVGKTFAAIQFPRAYVIDTERGTEHEQYVDLITKSGGAVFKTTEMHEVIEEVKSLLTEKHEYRTLVIDPITTVYNDLLDKSEKKVGSDFGRHYQAANKEMKRLYNLLMSLDLNVVLTAHAKKEYAPGAAMQVLGQTFDGWRSLDYAFDLVIELGKKGKQRFGRVAKSRIASFPDGESFDWSYDAIKARYDVSVLEKDAAPMALATLAQVAELTRLLEIVRLPEGTTEKWLAKAGVEQFDDMPAAVIAKCIEYVKGRLPAAA